MKKMVSLLAGAFIVGNASASMIWSDSFSYADGLVTNVAAGVWTNHSGATGPSIESGALVLSESLTQDVNRPLDAGYTSGSLFYGFDLNMEVLPSVGTATYFAHFKNSSTMFRDRLYVTNAVSGYMLAGSSATAAPTVWSSVLNAGTTYRIVVGADLDADTTTLWIDPTSELSPSLTVTAANAYEALAFAFRQAYNIGSPTVDNLAVGTTFADVVPEPSVLGLLSVFAATLFVRRLRRSTGR